MRDDRTARAKLRDAAMALVSEEGGAGLSARKVAARAGVSAGLVAHHFGSMDGLVQACDEYVASLIRDDKRGYLSHGLQGLDPMAALRQSESAHVMPYLARRLSDPGSETVARLVDAMITDAAGYIEEGEQNGLIRSSDDPAARTAFIMLASLGLMTLQSHVKRHLDVDLTTPTLGDEASVKRFMRTSYEVFSGLFTDELLTVLQNFAKED